MLYRRITVIYSLCLSIIACVLSACVNSSTCSTDADCKSGYDCYESACLKVCTKTDECPRDQTCFKYRCTKTNLNETKPSQNASSPVNQEDITLGELRAIRKEIELIRRQQDQIIEALKLPHQRQE